MGLFPPHKAKHLFSVPSWAPPSGKQEHIVLTEASEAEFSTLQPDEGLQQRSLLLATLF